MKRYIVVMHGTENGHPMTFYVTRPGMGRGGYRMAYTCQREIAAEFKKEDAQKYAKRFKGKPQAV